MKFFFLSIKLFFYFLKFQIPPRLYGTLEVKITLQIIFYFQVANRAMIVKLKINNVLQFDNSMKNVFKIISCMIPIWNYKRNTDSFSAKDRDIISEDRINLKCDCIDESTKDGTRQQTFSAFDINKPPGRNFFERKTIL